MLVFVVVAWDVVVWFDDVCVWGAWFGVMLFFWWCNSHLDLIGKDWYYIVLDMMIGWLGKRFGSWLLHVHWWAGFRPQYWCFIMPQYCALFDLDLNLSPINQYNGKKLLLVWLAHLNTVVGVDIEGSRVLPRLLWLWIVLWFVDLDLWWFGLWWNGCWVGCWVVDVWLAMRISMVGWRVDDHWGEIGDWDGNGGG